MFDCEARMSSLPRAMLIDTHLGTLATLTVISAARFDVWSSSNLTRAFRRAREIPADIVVVGADQPDPDTVSFLRYLESTRACREVLVTSTTLDGWSKQPLSLLVNGVFRRESGLVDLLERMHAL